MDTARYWRFERPGHAVTGDLSIGDPYLTVPNSLGVVTNIGTLLVVRRFQSRQTAG